MSLMILGGCHCGRITYRLAWPATVDAIPARACTCSFCRKHGASWTSHPGAALEVVEHGATASTRYAFATGTARFLVCPSCGVPVVVTSDVAGRTYAVVNTNTIERPARLGLLASSVTFDGESESQRLARRAGGWIADVSVGTGTRGRDGQVGVAGPVAPTA